MKRGKRQTDIYFDLNLKIDDSSYKSKIFNEIRFASLDAHHYLYVLVPEQFVCFLTVQNQGFQREKTSNSLHLPTHIRIFQNSRRTFHLLFQRLLRKKGAVERTQALLVVTIVLDEYHVLRQYQAFDLLEKLMLIWWGNIQVRSCFGGKDHNSDGNRVDIDSTESRKFSDCFQNG